MEMYYNIFGNRHGNTNGYRNWEPFCCHYKSTNIGHLKCTCGEKPDLSVWNWEPQDGINVVLSNNDRQIVFYPFYSSGTRVVRSSRPLRKNMHHYWEIKVLSKLYGTDTMIGVGSSKVRLDEFHYKFCSMLGCNNQSWGYSYKGMIQHNDLKRNYGFRYGMGSIISVYVDLCAGTLEYYLNRKPMGVAFRGLKEHELYPMICSTAAQSCVKVTCSMELEPSLQMSCLQVINKYPQLRKCYYAIPGLHKLLKKQYFWLIRPENEDVPRRNVLTIEDESVLPLSTILRHSGSLKLPTNMNKWGVYEARSDPDHISYRHSRRRFTIPNKQCIHHQIVNKDLAVSMPTSQNSSNSGRNMGNDKGRCYCSVSKGNLTHVDKKSKTNGKIKLVRLNLFRNTYQVGPIGADKLNDPNYCLEQENYIDDLECYTTEDKMSLDDQVPEGSDDASEKLDGTNENEMEVEKVGEFNSTECKYCEICDTTIELSTEPLNSIYDVVT